MPQKEKHALTGVVLDCPCADRDHSIDRYHSPCGSPSAAIKEHLGSIGKFGRALELEGRICGRSAILKGPICVRPPALAHSVQSVHSLDTGPHRQGLAIQTSSGPGPERHPLDGGLRV